MYYRKERLRFPSGPLKEIGLEQAIEEMTDLPLYDETPETFLLFKKDDEAIHVSRIGEEEWSFGMPNISQKEPRVLECTLDRDEAKECLTKFAEGGDYQKLLSEATRLKPKK